MATYTRDPRAPDPHESFESVDSPQTEFDDLDVALSTWQDGAICVARSSLRELACLRGWDDIYIGHHTFFAWEQGDPTARLAPDLYIVDDQPDPPIVRIWEAWQPWFRRPRWAMEVVSADWREDYLDNPPKYSQLGCSELVLFDQDLLGRSPETDGSGLRQPLTILRPQSNGKLHSVYSGPGPAYSQELKVWLAPRNEGDMPLIRLWLDEAGKQVVPTVEETRRRERDEAAHEAARREDKLIRERDEAIRQRDEAIRQREELARRQAETARRRHKPIRQRDDDDKPGLTEGMNHEGLDPHDD